MSKRLERSASSSTVMLDYKPALTVLLRQQEEAVAATLRSPYKNKQQKSGLGRNQPPSKDLDRKTAKGLLAAALPTANEVRATSASQLNPIRGQQGSSVLFRHATLSQPRSPDIGNGVGSGVNKLLHATVDVWQADPSKPSTAFVHAAAAAPSPTSSSSAPIVKDPLVRAYPGESPESRAYRSMPQHAIHVGSMYYTPYEGAAAATTAPGGAAKKMVRAASAATLPTRITSTTIVAPSQSGVLHIHQYADGNLVEDCACEKGTKLVEQDRAAQQQHQQQQQQQLYQQYSKDKPFEESKEQSPPAVTSTWMPQNLSTMKRAASAKHLLPPSALARANVPYAKNIRPVDTSRTHSLYASSFKPVVTQKYAKLGRGYFASHNKSYIRSCLQDPGYGFQLNTLQSQSQNDPTLQNFAAEITTEHHDPTKTLRAIIPKENWPQTMYHADYVRPSAELIKSYKRVGKNYRQAGNKSYIRANLLDPDYRDQNGELLDPQNQPNTVFTSPVPFTHETTHTKDYINFTPEYKTLRSHHKERVKFGSESNPVENIWSAPWDDNFLSEQEARELMWTKEGREQ